MNIMWDTVTVSGPDLGNGTMVLRVDLVEDASLNTLEEIALQTEAQRMDRPEDFDRVEPEGRGLAATLAKDPNLINPQQAYAWLETLVNRASKSADEARERVETMQRDAAQLEDRLQRLGA